MNRPNYRGRAGSPAIRRLLWAWLVLLVACTGCGRSPGVSTVPVSGVVTLDGKPVTQGTVQFVPTAPAEGFPMQPATGELGADGRFRMGTFAPRDGVVPGEYQVAVVSVVGGPTPDEPFAERVWNIPKQYGNPSTSGLSAEIPPGSRPVRLDFELTQ